MHCEYCGKEIGEARFCRYCGKEVIPPAKIEQWRQSISFSVLGVVISTVLLIAFQTRGVLGWIAFGVYLFIALCWFSVLTDKIEEIAELQKNAHEKREDFRPDSRFISFMNCLFGWLIGLWINKAVERGILGRTSRIAVVVIACGWLLTAIIGFSAGFLNVYPGKLAIRALTTVGADKNDSGHSVYWIADGKTNYLVFEPGLTEVSASTLDEMSDWYSDFGWEPDGGIRTKGSARGRAFVMESYVDVDDYGRIIIAFLQGRGGESIEIRCFYPEDSDLSARGQQRNAQEFLESIIPL